MINLNRQTLKLYKILDNTNKTESKKENKVQSTNKYTKFATFDSEKEEDILMEILIDNLINNGASFNVLMKAVELVENKKDKKELTTIITNITLNFIKLNPTYVDVFKQNNKIIEFLEFLDLVF